MIMNKRIALLMLFVGGCIILSLSYRRTRDTENEGFLPGTVRILAGEATSFIQKHCNNKTCVFRYNNPDVSSNTGKELYISLDLMHHFGWPPKYYVKMDPKNVTRSHVYATGANQNYFRPMLDTISQIQIKAPGYKIIVYDLGLNADSVKQEILRDYPGVFYMDSSVRLLKTGHLDHIRDNLLYTGGTVQMARTGHTVFAATHPDLYTFIPTNIERLKSTEMLAGGLVTMHRTKRAFDKVLFYWVLCALNPKCSQPKSTLSCNAKKLWAKKYADCHRYDQSTIAVLLANDNGFNSTLYMDPEAVDDKGRFVRVARGSYSKLALKTC